MKKKPAIEDLLQVMAKLRSPEGCPWDREQNHMTLRRHAIESGMVTLRQVGFRRAVQGQTTIEEILAVVADQE